MTHMIAAIDFADRDWKRTNTWLLIRFCNKRRHQLITNNITLPERGDARFSAGDFRPMIRNRVSLQGFRWAFFNRRSQGGVCRPTARIGSRESGGAGR
jgi:hypothetical protein